MDDTICLIKIEYVEYILSVANGFDNNIEFTFEKENDFPTFFDVLICENDNSIETTAYRNSTNNDIYLNRNTFAPDTWKRGALKILAERAYIVFQLKTFWIKNIWKRFSMKIIIIQNVSSNKY